MILRIPRFTLFSFSSLFRSCYCCCCCCCCCCCSCCCCCCCCVVVVFVVVVCCLLFVVCCLLLLFCGSLNGSSHDLAVVMGPGKRSEEHTSELQSLVNLVCRLLFEKKKTTSPSLFSIPHTLPTFALFNLSRPTPVGSFPVLLPTLLSSTPPPLPSPLFSYPSPP